QPLRTFAKFRCDWSPGRRAASRSASRQREPPLCARRVGRRSSRWGIASAGDDDDVAEQRHRLQPGSLSRRQRRICPRRVGRPTPGRPRAGRRQPRELAELDRRSRGGDGAVVLDHRPRRLRARRRSRHPSVRRPAAVHPQHVVAGPGQDMADSMVAWTRAPTATPGGWLLDRHGEVYAWGSAPALAPSQTWATWDIARGLAGGGSGGGSTERLILDATPLNDGWGAYYNQRDTRWASASVGAATYPVWKIGCLLSDLAMVYSHFGYGSTTPATIAAHTEW